MTDAAGLAGDASMPATTTILGRWRTEAGPRIAGSRPLDASKVQAPGVARLPGGGIRLFYTGVGPGRPYPKWQGYILSARSADGVSFEVEPGIRVEPDPTVPWRSRRALAPSVTRLDDGRWRMYFESRGPVGESTVIASAVSDDLFDWTVEDGIRLAASADVGGPRFVRLPDTASGGMSGARGRGRIYCFSRAHRAVVSAVTGDGLAFAWEPGVRLQGGATDLESAGVTAAEVVAPSAPGDPWVMVYSAWQDVPPGTVVPPHPSSDPSFEARNTGAAVPDFAAASIAADLAGYRSRIFAATSADGLTWERAGLLIEGGGPGSPGLDAVHAEDMCLTPLDDGGWRMYYAACDAAGRWTVASAITDGRLKRPARPTRSRFRRCPRRAGMDRSR